MISNDEVQDFHSVHKAQELVKGYLEEQLHIKELPVVQLLEKVLFVPHMRAQVGS